MDRLNKVLFLSQMHCTGEHGKSARWLREHMDVDAVAGCFGADTYIHYPIDMGYGLHVMHVRQQLKDAEAVILEEGTPAHYGITPSDLDGKVVVRDAHGTFTRRNVKHLSDWDYSHSVIYRTCDLGGILPATAQFVPCSVDLHDAVFLQSEGAVETEKMVVAHAPTNRGVKGTHILRAALKELPDVELIMSEFEPNAYSLWKRRRANVYFDNIADGTYYGYKGVMGVAGIEAAAQRQVVIGDFSCDTEDVQEIDWTWEKDVAGVLGALRQLQDSEYRRLMSKRWSRWVKENRSREKVMPEFYAWLCRQSPFASA